MQSKQVKLSSTQKELLKKISLQRVSSVCEVERSGILLYLSESGASSTKASLILGIPWTKVQRWRNRWLSAFEKVNELERQIKEGGENAPKAYELENYLRLLLNDSPRPGCPSKFSALDYCKILGVALEDPALSGRPISEWSLVELKDEVEKREIVSSISRSQLGSFLKSERNKAT